VVFDKQLAGNNIQSTVLVLNLHLMLSIFLFCYMKITLPAQCSRIDLIIRFSFHKVFILMSSN